MRRWSIFRNISIALATISMALAGCYKVTIVWPNEPLKVTVTNCPALASGGGGLNGEAGEADAAVEPPPAEPVHARLSDKPLLLAEKGTVVFVEYNGGNYGTGVSLFEVDAGSSAKDACLNGSGRRDLWKLANGGRWDAQQTVDGGKAICAEGSGGSSDGEIIFLRR